MTVAKNINRLFAPDSLTLSDDAIIYYGSKDEALAACQRLELVFPSLKTPGSVIQAEIEAERHLTELERVCGTMHLNPLMEHEVIAYQKSKVQRTFGERAGISFRESLRRLKQFFMHGALGKVFAFAMWLFGYPAVYALLVGFEQTADGRWDATPAQYLIIGIGVLLVVIAIQQAAKDTSPTQRSSKSSRTLSEEELREKAKAYGKMMKKKGEWVPTQKGLEILYMRKFGHSRERNNEASGPEIKGVETSVSLKKFRNIVRWTLAAPLALPVILALYVPIALIGTFFVPVDSGRRWRKMSVENFLAGKELSFDIIAALDRIIAWFPGEQIEVIALCNRGEKVSQEAFLAIDVRGQDQKKLYLEHILH